MRGFRLVRYVGGLAAITRTLWLSLPSMASIITLIAITTFVYASAHPGQRSPCLEAGVQGLGRRALHAGPSNTRSQAVQLAGAQAAAGHACCAALLHMQPVAQHAQPLLLEPCSGQAGWQGWGSASLCGRAGRAGHAGHAGLLSAALGPADIGAQLFPTVKWGMHLTRQVNFTSFTRSFLFLLQTMTGAAHTWAAGGQPVRSDAC